MPSMSIVALQCGGWAASERWPWIAATLAAVLLWGTAMARFTDAAAPYVDAMTAGLSVAAQVLQSLRRVESWLLWICVDVVALGLFTWRGLFITTGLYGLFLLLAIVGLVEWKRKAKA